MDSYLAGIFDVHRAIEYGGLAIVLIIIYIETGFFLGFVLPGGDYMLFAAGLFCGTEYLDVPVAVLIFLLIIASFLGDLTGYHKGKWLGEKLFNKPDNRIFKSSYLTRGTDFYNKYGIMAFVLGKFMPVIRTLIPMIAGATKFKKFRFLGSSITGSVVWIGTLVPLGYFIGKKYPGIIEYSGYILLVFIVIASFPMIRILFSKKQIN
jgi:membrane-associated protein